MIYIFGYSDDNVEIRETEHRDDGEKKNQLFEEEIGCYDNSIVFMIGGKIKDRSDRSKGREPGVRVRARYGASCGKAAWSMEISPIEDEVPMFKVGIDMERYSARACVEAPVGTRILWRRANRKGDKWKDVRNPKKQDDQ